MVSTAETLSASSAKALEEFMALKDLEYVEVWKSLPAAPFQEMHGEFRGQFPPNMNEAHKKWQAEGLFNENSPNGYWLCKAFKPLGQVTGEGYNVFRLADGNIVRRARFGTHLGVSRVDGRPALIMTYASFNRDVTWETDTVDEIRKLADGVYLGVGTMRLDAAVRMENSALEIIKTYGLFEEKEKYELHERTPAAPILFVLTGPVEEWVGPDEPMADDR